MKLNILISHYKEKEEIVKPLLDSIETQKGVPFKQFKVIIVNDGQEGLLSQEFLNEYSYKIEYYTMPKGNISKVRNFALEKATAQYVMFCDCDDYFLTENSLAIIFREMKRPFSVLNSTFIQQVNEEQGVLKKNDTTFIHGKVFNRQFLLDNDIKFDEELYVHEDSYFVTLAQTLAVEHTLRVYPLAFYVWAVNDGSISRQEGFIQKTWNEYIKSRKKLIDELLKRGIDDVARITFAQILLEAKERNLSKDNMLITAQFLEEHRDLYNSITDEERKIIEKGASETWQHKVTLETRYYDKLLEIG